MSRISENDIPEYLLIRLKTAVDKLYALSHSSVGKYFSATAAPILPSGMGILSLGPYLPVS